MGLHSRWSELKVADWRRTRMRCSREFENFEKQLLIFYRWSVLLGFSDPIRSDQFGSLPAEKNWDLKHLKMRPTAAGSGGSNYC